MHLLIPGRHHLLTEFQFKYLFRILNSNSKISDIDGNILPENTHIESIIFAVTSANHAGTKRNPLPFHLRAMMIQSFSVGLDVPCYVFGIDDAGQLEDFADYTVKTIGHASNHEFNLSPENTSVICSTPVLDMYQKKGYRILPAELEDHDTQSYHTTLPWEFVERICSSENWMNDADIVDGIHFSSLKLWNTYNLDKKVRSILQDPIIGDDGDITESRDYNTYVRQMDDIAELKFNDTLPFIKSGNIGDIGCAVGSWIKLACDNGNFMESDFYGIEVARQLFDICQQRKHNGEFNSPAVFFAMKNAVTSLVFEKESMNTIHTSSLTHEIESYGSHQDLLDFIKNRFDELKPGGVWINRDVIGPEDGNKTIYMSLNTTDGDNEEPLRPVTDAEELKVHLEGLSTYGRFLRFADDFRRSEGYQLEYSIRDQDGKKVAALKYKDAADFILTKDYTDNWQSEMHETFCFWSFSDWKHALESVGFKLKSESKAYQNPWILENRWIGKVELFQDQALSAKQNFPPTNMLMVAEKL